MKKSKKARSADLDELKILENFIKKGKGAANCIENSSSSCDVNSSKNYITPNGILWQELENLYGNIDDQNRFEQFVKNLLRRLSEFVSEGQEKELFSDDFNSFIEMIVRTLNVAGKMKELLEENGIDFDIEDFLNGNGDGSK